MPDHGFDKVKSDLKDELNFKGLPMEKIENIAEDDVLM